MISYTIKTIETVFFTEEARNGFCTPQEFPAEAFTEEDLALFKELAATGGSVPLPAGGNWCEFSILVEEEILLDHELNLGWVEFLEAVAADARVSVDDLRTDRDGQRFWAQEPRGCMYWYEGGWFTLYNGAVGSYPAASIEEAWDLSRQVASDEYDKRMVEAIA